MQKIVLQLHTKNTFLCLFARASDIGYPFHLSSLTGFCVDGDFFLHIYAQFAYKLSTVSLFTSVTVLDSLLQKHGFNGKMMIFYESGTKPQIVILSMAYWISQREWTFLGTEITLFTLMYMDSYLYSFALEMFSIGLSNSEHRYQFNSLHWHNLRAFVCKHCVRAPNNWPLNLFEWQMKNVYAQSKNHWVCFDSVNSWKLFIASDHFVLLNFYSTNEIVHYL